jgi:hypothetical protein
MRWKIAFALVHNVGLSSIEVSCFGVSVFLNSIVHY